MLNAALFIADPNMAGLVRKLASESSAFVVGSVAELGTAGYPIGRTLGTVEPELILLEITEPDRDLPIANAIHTQAPSIPLVGLAPRNLEPLLRGTLSSDVATLAIWPFTVTELEAAIRTAVQKVSAGIYENLVAILPGKAGSGASTVVLHTAFVAAQELKRRVLVLEGDLHSGLLAESLRVAPKASIREVLAEAAQLDNIAWERYVTQAGGVDFLLADTAIKEPIPSWADYFQLLRFAAPKYDLILVDLPEVVNSATAEVVRRAHAVYVVSTPEIAALELSKQRRQEVAGWGADGARIKVLLNRGHKSDIGPQEAEKITECPVAIMLPNDYKAVRRATAAAGVIDRHSDLGQAYLAFSRMLIGAEPEKKSFMGFFRK